MTKLRKINVWQSPKTQIVKKLRVSSCDKNLKTQNLTTNKLKQLKFFFTTFKISNCDKNNHLKLCKHSKLKKLRNYIFTWLKKGFWWDNMTHQQPMRCTRRSFVCIQRRHIHYAVMQNVFWTFTAFIKSIKIEHNFIVCEIWKVSSFARLFGVVICLTFLFKTL